MTTAPASAAATVDRKAVRKFFDFRVNNDALKLRAIPWKPLLWTMAGGLVFGLAWTRSLAGATVVAALVGAAFYGLDRWFADLDVKRRRTAKEKNHAQFFALADQVRAIQAKDVSTAFLRVFTRTHLDPRVLMPLDHRFSSSKERELFSEQSLEELLGDLQNKSIRLHSPGDFKNKKLRHIRWMDPPKREELFFNPIRLVVLFLAMRQLVICDVQIDSMDGDLSEEIQRVAFEKIVNIQFTAERKRRAMVGEELVTIAEDLGYTKDEIEAMQKSVEPWVREEMISHLGVTRTDSNSLTMPISIHIYFGQHRSALDQGSTLTADETEVDLMINALSRKVENPDGVEARTMAAGRGK